jgi:hypothetical protein
MYLRYKASALAVQNNPPIMIHPAYIRKIDTGNVFCAHIPRVYNMADAIPPSFETLIETLAVQDSNVPSKPVAPANSANAGPSLPPQMKKSAEEMAAELNRIPLFMTHLDETDGEGGENLALEGLRAIAFEGARSEVAANFRENGNECAREKRWADAKGYYDQALHALKEPRRPPVNDDGMELQLDEEVEAKKEKVIEEACYVNRALCNLELSTSLCRRNDNFPSNSYLLYQKTIGLATLIALQLYA